MRNVFLIVFDGFFRRFCRAFSGSARLEEHIQALEEMSVEHINQAVELREVYCAAHHTRQPAHRLIFDAHYQRVGKGLFADGFHKPYRKTNRTRERSARPTAGIAQLFHRRIVIHPNTVLLIEVQRGFRYLSAEQRLELFVSDVCRIAAVIRREFLSVVRVRGIRAFDVYLCRQSATDAPTIISYSPPSISHLFVRILK